MARFMRHMKYFPSDIYGDLKRDELPSKVAMHSVLGTSLTRHRMTQERRNATGSGTLDDNTMEDAHKRGLRLGDESRMDELERTSQLEIIRNMPVSIRVKKILRENLLGISTTEKDTGCWALYCYKAKLARLRRERSCRMCCLDFDQTITLWSGAFKKIGGFFGSGVLTYFTFLKWLFQLNLFISLINFLFITLPMIVFASQNYDSLVTSSDSTSAAVNLSIQCSALYSVNQTGEWYAYILDFIQGSGFMEKTVVFYGYYSATELNIPNLSYSYNMPLAYLVCVLFYFIVSLCVMVHNTAKGFRERVFVNPSDYSQFCNKVFGGWDFSIEDGKNAKMIHIALYREMNSLLTEFRLQKQRDSWTCAKECTMALIRILIWTLVLVLLGASGYFMYFITIKQSELTTSSDFQNYHILVQFMIEYMTSVTMTILNAVLPFIFKLLVKLEDYTAGVSVNITLARTVLLKLASIAVIVGTIYTQIVCGTKDTCGVGYDTCTPLRCWETYIGQEMYKLVVINLFVQVAVVFLLETPRRIIVDKCQCKLTELLGRQEFDIPKGVLDLIYMEALLWFGSFFSPLIAAMTTFIMFILFYLKYFTVIYNCKPLDVPYRASKSSEFFLITLLVTYTLCIAPLVYVIYLLNPSKGCGPFRIYTYMYEIIPITLDSWPAGIQHVISFFTTAAVIVPLFVIMCLVIYYLAQVIITYKSMVSIMKQQLQLESRDKEFLLSKLKYLGNGSQNNNNKKKAKSAKRVKLERKSSVLGEEPESVVIVGGRDDRASTQYSTNTPPGVPHDNGNSHDLSAF